jgi:hypothetical protein
VGWKAKFRHVGNECSGGRRVIRDHFLFVLQRAHNAHVSHNTTLLLMSAVLLYGQVSSPMKKQREKRIPSAKKPVTDLSNSEIVVIAALRAGAAGVHVDTEDIAVKANEIGPGRFSWKKYPDQINIDSVRKRLWDARKRGHLVGSERDGWLLTEVGAAFARKYRRSLSVEKTTRLSLNERKWRRLEKARLLATAAYMKFGSGQISSITAREAQGFFRIDAYVSKSAIENKILRVLNAFGDDREIGPTARHVASLVRGGDVVEDHLR